MHSLVRASIDRTVKLLIVVFFTFSEHLNDNKTSGDNISYEVEYTRMEKVSNAMDNIYIGFCKTLWSIPRQALNHYETFCALRSGRL
jgi:hypothetical protein